MCGEKRAELSTATSRERAQRQATQDQSARNVSLRVKSGPDPKARQLSGKDGRACAEQRLWYNSEWRNCGTEVDELIEAV